MPITSTPPGPNLTKKRVLTPDTRGELETNLNRKRYSNRINPFRLNF